MIIIHRLQPTKGDAKCMILCCPFVRPTFSLAYLTNCLKYKLHFWSHYHHRKMIWLDFRVCRSKVTGLNLCISCFGLVNVISEEPFWKINSRLGVSMHHHRKAIWLDTCTRVCTCTSKAVEVSSEISSFSLINIIF